MTYSSQARLSPEFTPPIIKKLIFTIIGISLFAALIDPLLISFLKVNGFQVWFTLNAYGYHHYYIWQVITYLFVYPSPGGIHPFYLLNLFFQMYFLWILGTAVYEYIGKRSFLRLFFGAGLAMGCLGFLLMTSLASYGMLGGTYLVLMTLFAFWIMLYPDTEILLFFILPVPAKWLFLGISGAAILISLSQGQFFNLFMMLPSVGIGYFYGVGCWDLRTPFPQTHAFDRRVSKWAEPLRRENSFVDRSLKDIYDNVKIFDFKSGKAIMSDDEFLDAMLNKISQFGDQSLTWEERERMQDISRKRTEKDKKRKSR